MIEHKMDLSATEALFAALDAALTDMTPVMNDLGELLTTSTKDRFPTGTAPDGTKWAPKSQTTLNRYGAKKSNRVDSRPLFGPSGLLSRLIFHEASATEVSWGSNLIYSAVMQFGAAKGAFGTMSNGASIPWGNIPARPFIGVSATDEANMTATLEDWLSGAVEKP
ncbi:MAG: phage virion morphogenesis protein [Pseudotabrizicola sp.]|uniref:phage virion morphogenesis protein n=1 Tax=Pseudotabrizicola sp. TaxID=2939647 RepID=UPI0027232396|nr:phage virion morphogenesis protein [Pseudotabrizicola sp.]MDO9639682.1 phage virion morphogenesis protein [Pseudotabrizicola sp.]